MIESYWLAAASAFWLGILTAVSPCPLAANVAAITYIGKHMSSPRRVMISGALYAVGRTVTYVVLGALLVASIMTASRLSDIMQSYFSKLVGPLLILVGMVLLDLVGVTLPGMGNQKSIQRHASSGGLWGSLGLGMFLALSFCPISAALFFGSLVPLAVDHNSYVAYPLLYGLGTGLPVLVFGVGLGLGVRWVGRVVNKLPQIERWARRITGVVFVVAGIYLSLVYIFGVL
jgi:cytochrome c biogenesis protein CcdA